MFQRKHFQTSIRAIGAAAAVSAGIGLASHASAQVQWTNGPDTSFVAMNNGQIGRELGQLASRVGQTHIVVQFTRPIMPAERQAVINAGIDLLDYLGDHAYVAAVSGADLDIKAALRAAPWINARALQNEWKAHRSFLDGQPQSHTLIPAGVVDDVIAPTGNPANPNVAVIVQFHRDLGMGEAELALVEAHGGAIWSLVPTINAVTVLMPFENVLGLAAEDAVKWVEPPIPVLTATNDQNRAMTGADIVQSPPYSLDGDGVVAFVYDAGKTNNHVDYQSRRVVLPGDTSGTINHATHVAGTIGGDGTGNPNYKGMAPAVTILTAGFEWDSTPFFWADPGDIDLDYTRAFNPQAGDTHPQADVANSSIGSNTESNGFPCEIQGDYGLASELIDAIVRGDDGRRTARVVWAAGNERQGSRCNIEGHGDYYSTAPPACAKNHITVGALNSNDGSVTGFTSWGPTDDGRLKPDVSAPGCQSDGDRGVTSSTGTSGYSSYCGTSMAAPTVAGLSALLLQDYAVQFPGRPEMHGSTLKALLAHNALDIQNPGPDYQTGYGSVRIQPTVDFMRTAQFTEQEIGQGETHRVTVDVLAGDPYLKMTLAWDDFQSVAYTTPNLVNDLDLRVFDPDGVRHYGWTLNPDDPAAPATRDREDHLNNIEQVFVEIPMPGTWVIEIVGTTVPEGPQPYSLTGSPALGVSFVSIGLPSDVPETVRPNDVTSIDVIVRAVADTIVAGSEKLHYRFDGGQWLDVQMVDLGDGQYRADLPGPACGDTPEFYFSVEGTSFGLVTNPTEGELAPYTATVGEWVNPVSEDFEQDNGWTVDNQGAWLGLWVREVPFDGSFSYEPSTDYDGSGKCWVTGNTSQDDVDGGPMTLISEAYDLTTTQNPTLSYARWFYNDDSRNGDPNDDDVLVVEISSDNGDSWVLLETVVDARSTHTIEWDLASFTVADYIPLTNAVRLRFTVSDNPNNSRTEAAIDAIDIRSFDCRDSCPADFNGDGIVNTLDFLAFLNAYNAGDLAADFNGDGTVNTLDFLAFLNAFNTGC